METLEETIPAARRLTQEYRHSSPQDMLEAILLDFERVLRALEKLEDQVNRLFNHGIAET